MKYTKQSFSVEIMGRIGGSIWWPYGYQGTIWKDFRHVCNDFSCLRDVILEITNDGDFEDCNIIEGTIKATLIKPNRRVVRYFDLSLPLFKSIDDCFVDNPEDFVPSYED